MEVFREMRAKMVRMDMACVVMALAKEG